ncbi:glycosyl hydrolase family 85-domain-containing protein [Irpex rosettiformis]|uniref:Glycosyl hydrolase family 85-domain-containing protein n=1 Tax=Irpex rosettiformis TaxID=378272 RepID=A0ACB8UF04_9APHY|nr:glycosyl hydrolase family 85-domain-containing protein [Irpex rosettiformis]
MPLRGKNHSPAVSDDAPFFVSLGALDDWADQPNSARPLSGVLPYIPRSSLAGENSTTRRGKLLVCHDYKGGYTEKPAGLAYTFNFWSLCDTFIYFAHHRVTIPPSGWTNAAHRQGVKMLGTLIFEHQESEPDVLRLLVGRLPQRRTNGPARPSENSSLPVSRHYARLLADLAYQRGFDGYLLNIETPLRGGIDRCRTLSTWIALLEIELKKRVGAHAQVIWYDSVILNGQLIWQDRLNGFNLPFFLPSTGFFTNYTWPSHYPSVTAQYFTSLNQTTKQLNDIFTGVDVWGRGQHGGGGLACYKALSHIDPKSLGLSVALFGHGWTWESQQDQPGWDWETWWAYERLFWAGPANISDIPTIADTPDQRGQLCAHGPYQPIADFFQQSPPPNPSRLSFFTSFSPGVGRAWFVNGAKVWEIEAGSPGWTDLDKTNSLGDLVWPKPTLSWQEMEHSDPLPIASSSIVMEDAWIGGSSLKLVLNVVGSEAEDAFFRCVWVPVQSLAVTSGKTYTATVIIKPSTTEDQSAEVDVGLSVKIPHAALGFSAEITGITPDTTFVDHSFGWQKLDIQFAILADHETDVQVEIGLILGLIIADPTLTTQVSVMIGSLAIYPSLTSSSVEPVPKLIWADFAPKGRNTPFSGVLTWETGGQHLPLNNIIISSTEDPFPAWLTSLAVRFPFIYFNIYANVRKDGEGDAVQPEDAAFVGTTGLDGRANRFFVDPASLPSSFLDARALRFYIQGVTERGLVLPWKDCVFVDVDRE